MLDYAEPVTKLIDEFKRLPSIGQKSAQRLAFHILRTPESDVERLIQALREVKERITECSICNNLTDVNPCRFCSAPSRDRSMLCIVEQPYDLVAVEKTRSYKGLYHVLHGSLSPIRGVRPSDLRLDNLLPRLKPENNEPYEEVFSVAKDSARFGLLTINRQAYEADISFCGNDGVIEFNCRLWVGQQRPGAIHRKHLLEWTGNNQRSARDIRSDAFLDQ
jgi:recombination protein RecR